MSIESIPQNHDGPKRHRYSPQKKHKNEEETKRRLKKIARTTSQICSSLRVDKSMTSILEHSSMQLNATKFERHTNFMKFLKNSNDYSDRINYSMLSQ
jgi:HD-like signal output (HDOD) protein